MQSIIQRAFIIITLITATGILIHDTKVDYATKTALALPAILITLDLDKAFRHGSDHTHVERVSLSQAMRTMPKVKPHDGYSRFLLTQKVNKGTQPFDGYYLPDSNEV